MSVVFDPERQHRRSIRLRGYDYTQAGAYFVTIVTQDRACLFGEVVDGHMRLNDAGRMVAAEWDALRTRFINIDLDAFVVMPNHIHGVIVITGPIGTDGSTVGAPLVGAQFTTGAETTGATVGAPLVGAQSTRAIVGAPLVGAQSTTGDIVGAPLVGAQSRTRAQIGATTRVAPTIVPMTTMRGRAVGHIVGAFKSFTTVAYTRGFNTQGWSPFRGRLWQRNYFEHIVRNEESLHRIRQYITDNPAHWTDDPENPQRIVGAVPCGRPDAGQIFCGPGADPDSGRSRAFPRPRAPTRGAPTRG